MKLKPLFGDFGLIYCAIIWGSTFFIMKDALNSINPFALVAYRFIFAALLLGIIAIYLKKPLFKNFRQGASLGVLLTILYLSQVIGLQFTTASNSGFITGLFIIFVPLFGLLLFHNTPTKKRIVAIVLSIIGLWLLTGGMTQMNLGDVLTLAAAVTYGLHILFTGKFVKKIDAYTLTFQQFLVVGVLALVLAIIFNQPLTVAPSVQGAVIFLILFPTLLAYLIQTVAQKHASAVKVALIFALEPVSAAIFAWTLGGELFIPIHALGGLLIVAGIVISELPETKNSNTKKAGKLLAK